MASAYVEDFEDFAALECAGVDHAIDEGLGFFGIAAGHKQAVASNEFVPTVP